MAYRVAVVDDSDQDAGLVQEILAEWAADRQVEIRSKRFSSAESFIFQYAEDKDWDILLLDIEMGPMDGVTMARRGARG